MYLSASVIALIFNFAKALQQSKPQSVVYTFDNPISGIVGTITTRNANGIAKISTKLNFSEFNSSRVCDRPVREFTYHIHTKWSSDLQSESFDKCSLALTGNHYDPLKACGPNSEYSDTSECKAKVDQYNCTPDTYRTDQNVCEKGDLSGKLGSYILKTKKPSVVSNKVDRHYPMPFEYTFQWNIVIHAVCGNATPRVACAVGKQS